MKPSVNAIINVTSTVPTPITSMSHHVDDVNNQYMHHDQEIVCRSREQAPADFGWLDRER